MIVITSEAAQRLTQVQDILTKDLGEFTSLEEPRRHLAIVCNEIHAWLSVQDPAEDVPDEILIARARTMLREYRTNEVTDPGHLTRLDECLQALQQRTLPRHYRAPRTEDQIIGDIAERERLEAYVQIYARSLIEIYPGKLDHDSSEKAITFAADLVVRLAQATIKKLDEVTR